MLGRSTFTALLLAFGMAACDSAPSAPSASRGLASMDTKGNPAGGDIEDLDETSGDLVGLDVPVRAVSRERTSASTVDGGTTTTTTTTTGGGEEETEEDVPPLAAPPATPPASNTVEFRITAGTANGEWNNTATMVSLKVGQRLRIINNDTVNHQLHTPETPFAHGNIIPPGGMAEYTVTTLFNPYPNGDVTQTRSRLYDHNLRTAANDASFWMQVIP